MRYWGLAEWAIVLFVTALIVALIAGLTWITVGVWNECRAENSFFYCLKLISR